MRDLPIKGTEQIRTEHYSCYFYAFNVEVLVCFINVKAYQPFIRAPDKVLTNWNIVTCYDHD